MTVTSISEISATRWFSAKRSLAHWALVAALAMVCAFAPVQEAAAGTYQPDGTYTGTPSPTVTAIFAAFPNGGDGLLNAIRDLLVANPALADDVAYLASRGTPGQQADAAIGMSQAFTALNNSGNISGATRLINAAQFSANPVLQTALTNAVGRSALFADRSSNPLTGASNCRPPVSPSAPQTCQ